MSYKYVYAISHSEYSDYSVTCICETEEEANKLRDKLNDETNETVYKYYVERFLLCDSSIQKTLVLSISITLWDDGTESQKVVKWTEEWPFNYEGNPSCNWRWTRAPIHKEKGGTLEVWGTNFTLVRRTYKEKRLMLKNTKNRD